MPEDFVQMNIANVHGNERRADAEAERIHPTFTRKDVHKLTQAEMLAHTKRVDELDEQYEAEIAQKWNLTKDQFTQIGVEAVKKGWPMP